MQPTFRGLRRRLDRRRRALEEPYRSVYPYTQVSDARQRNLVDLCRRAEAGGIPGVVMECGVLDGGTAALMAWATRDSGRAAHLFDAWRGMPPRAEQDGAEADRWVGQIVGSPRRARRAMRRLNVDPARVRLHAGWFHETFPAAADEIDAVAVLHVDCDFYDPTRLTLETWWPRLSPGGFAQFDDYTSFRGCRAAVDEFRAAHPGIELHAGGHNGTAFYLRKAG